MKHDLSEVVQYWASTVYLRQDCGDTHISPCNLGDFNLLYTQIYRYSCCAVVRNVTSAAVGREVSGYYSRTTYKF